MSDVLDTTAIDILSERETRIPLLHNLQANILKHHGRDHAWHIFLEFIPGKETEIKQWISTELAGKNSGMITSAYKQLTDVELRRISKVNNDLVLYDGGIITCFFLSAKGYDRLGFPPEFIAGPEKFFDSMRDRRNVVLKDPDPGSWEPSFRIESHAMLLLADDKKSALKKMLKKIRQQTAGIMHIISNAKGEILRNKKQQAIEHFGYEDGISQPKFLASDPENETSEWRDFAPLSAILVPDRGTTEPDCFGSYMVFRKLEQNIKLFFSLREQLAKTLLQVANPQNEKLAGAFVVGRFENGIPVSESDNENHPMNNKNDFDYESDPGAFRCPYHAHMRITNPRFRLEKKLGNIRILRRGIPYDEIGRKEDLSDRPEHGVGLFFISYQNSISNFETIQTWAGGGNVIMHPLRGVDGIAGQGTYDNQAQDWPKKWDSPANGHHEEDLFMHVVTLLGGEYFFTPSLPFLANLK